MDKYLITKEEIDQYEGVDLTHFLNENAVRNNKSLGDMVGLKHLGFHIVEILPGNYSSEFHMHFYEDECIYILEGKGEARIGDETHPLKAGDFIGYRAGGAAHNIFNNGGSSLKCIVVGQRLDHDVGDYPEKNKRIYRNQGMDRNIVDKGDIDSQPTGRRA